MNERQELQKGWHEEGGLMVRKQSPTIAMATTAIATTGCGGMSDL